jgi:hypothetical protein
MDSEFVWMLSLSIEGIILISLWTLLKQQCRVLLRLDGPEQAQQRRVTSHEKRLGLEATGLSFGTQVPQFRLPDMEGRSTSLVDFQGRRVLLINWNTECCFCVRVARELALLHETFNNLLATKGRSGPGAPWPDPAPVGGESCD